MSNTGEGCINKDHGVFDRYGDNCSWYNELHVSRLPYACGTYDDDDFTANNMCCACKGVYMISINWKDNKIFAPDISFQIFKAFYFT